MIVDQSAAAVVHLVDALLDPQRRAGQFADRHQLAVGQRPAQGRHYLSPVAEDADVEAIEYGLPQTQRSTKV